MNSVPHQTEPSIPWGRQGARNVAGVTYQVAVSAYLLAQGRAGALKITTVTPEGMEDIDCLCSDGSSIAVQAKERGDGFGMLSPAEVADILSHALPALESSLEIRFALVTNAQLGGDLAFTGWDTNLTDQLSASAIAGLLASVDSPKRAADSKLLGRSALISLPRHLGADTTLCLSTIYKTSPAVAALIYSKLLEDLSETAAAQRHKTPKTAVARQLADLDAIAHKVSETVDSDALEEAVRDGIVEPLNFTTASNLTAENYLVGVDTSPAHIAANLDLPRQGIISEIHTGLREEGYAAIVGPSGSGKSSLLWRAARNCGWTARKTRILRLGVEQVPSLMRWIRWQQPSAHAPLLLCADNLGRASMNGWPLAVRQIREMPGVYLLGAVRREDFDVALVATAPRVVEPSLDEALAKSIAQTLRDRGIATKLDAVEAFSKSGSLLMEFLSLLLAGRRMRDVITAQVEALLAPEHKTERDVLRCVCTAHRVGISVPAATLNQLVAQPDNLHKVLARLRKEHLLTENEQTEWVGLHELRSDLISEVLHSLPPPTEPETFCALLAALPFSSRPQLLRRYGYLSRATLDPFVAEIAKQVTLPQTNCGQAAELCAALRECECVRHARECLKVARDKPDRTISSIYDRLLFAVLARETGFVLPVPTPSVDALAKALPKRPPSKVSEVLKTVGVPRLVELAKNASTEEAAYWLETIEGYIDLPLAAATEIWETHANIPIVTRGKILASLSQLAKLTPAQLDKMAGSIENRAKELASNHRNGLSATISTDKNEGLIVTVEIMVTDEEEGSEQQAIIMAEQVLAYCPEAAVSEVITRDPGGKEYSIDGRRSAYYRIPRKNLPRATTNRPQTEFLDAAKRLLAARFWTERLRLESTMSNELISLLEQLPVRLLNRFDGHGRRKRWRDSIDLFQSKSLPPPPHANLNRNTSDPAAQAFAGISLALRQLANGMDKPDEGLAMRTASQLREALIHLAAVHAEARPSLPSIGDPIPYRLYEQVRASADLLFALADDDHRKWWRDKGDAPDWTSVATRVVAEARQRQISEELDALQAICKAWKVTSEISRCVHDNPKSMSLVSDRWVVWLDWKAWAMVEKFSPLPGKLRLRMAFRTFIIAVEGRVVLPFLAMQVGADNLFPVDPLVVKECCQVAQREVARSPHLDVFGGILNNVVNASRSAALYWRRPADWRRAVDLDRAGELLTHAKSVIPSIPNEGIQQACQKLVLKVEAEVKNAQHPFAAAFVSLPPEPDEAAVWEEVNALTIAVAECALVIPSL